VTLPHPVFGQVKMQNVHPKLSETPGEVRWPGPALGEHTEAVLTGVLGMTPRRVAELRTAKVI
jgi:formyl-CoA transferase